MSVETVVTELLKERVPSWNGNLMDWDTSALSSLDYLELMFELEERYGLLFPGDISDLRTPQDLIRYIEANTDVRPNTEG